MAFLSKMGGLFKQTVGKQMSAELAASKPSLFQAIRAMSTSKLFIGGLSYSTDDTSLRDAFTQYGEVIEARVIMDRESGRSRGFGFVSFTSTEEASKAIQAMDGQDLHGRRVRVNYATDRAAGGGGGFRSGGGGYGGGGYGGGGGGYGGGGYSGGGGYGGGGDSYGSGGGGYGGGSYNSGGGYDGGSGGGGSYGGSAGGYGSPASFDGGNAAGGFGGNAAGGFGGNAAGSFGGSSETPVGGYGGNSAMPPFGGSNDLGGGFGQADQGEGSFKDNDDAPEDFAKRM